MWKWLATLSLPTAHSHDASELIPIPVWLMNDIYHWISKRWGMFKMQTFSCLSLKISTQNLNLCGQNYIVHKKEMWHYNILLDWVFASSRPTGISAKLAIHTVVCSLSIHIFWHIYVLIHTGFSREWESHSHGNQNPTGLGIPFPSTSLHWISFCIQLWSYCEYSLFIVATSWPEGNTNTQY